MQRTTLRNFVFTLNNYTDDDLSRLRGAVASFVYIIWGKEVGESGTPHLQGMAQLVKPTKFNSVKAIIGDRAHIEVMHGTAQQARDYCAKDGDFEEFGELRHQGARRDLSTALVEISEARSLREAVLIAPEIVVKYPRGIQTFIEAHQEPRHFKPRVVWLWGATGTGKTRSATECESYYIKDSTKWWDGYAHQDRIILDDYDHGAWDFRNVLRLLDRYEYQGETKGGYVHINSREIYITCEFAPATCYSGSKLAQLVRRIDEIVQLTEVNGE